MLQVVGSLLAIPVGLASGYSIYRANFSVETTCQSLRANIVSMIDKSVDAGTRRMLVRRDVETFEQTCGTVDPDATAAFKALLAADKPAAAGCAPVARNLPRRRRSKRSARSSRVRRPPNRRPRLRRTPQPSRSPRCRPCPTRSGSMRFARPW